MKQPQFYYCPQCHVIIEEIQGDKKEYTCCGMPLKEMIAGSFEGAVEKHQPLVEQKGNTVFVNVGSVQHPMSEEHNIGWVYLQTEKGRYLHYLDVTAAPTTTFLLAENEKAIAVYAYCNLHGFWKTEL